MCHPRYCSQQRFAPILPTTPKPHPCQAMAANLLRSGHFAELLIWNRSPSKCDTLAAEGAVSVATPAEAVERADIVFGMLADPQAALDVSVA